MANLCLQLFVIFCLEGGGNNFNSICLEHFLQMNSTKLNINHWWQTWVYNLSFYISYFEVLFAPWLWACRKGIRKIKHKREEFRIIVAVLFCFVFHLRENELCWLWKFILKLGRKLCVKFENLCGNLAC